MNKTEYIACGKNKPPEDWTDYELPYIVVSEKKYDKENEMLIYNGEFKGQWGGIVCDPTIKD